MRYRLQGRCHREGRAGLVEASSIVLYLQTLDVVSEGTIAILASEPSLLLLELSLGSDLVYWGLSYGL